MNEPWILIYLLGGIGLLSFGAHTLIRGAVSLGFRVGLPSLVIGLSILGYGTGMPELIVSVQASMAGNGDIAMGNVIGSNIANMGLILGITALYRPLPVSKQQIGYNGVIMVVIRSGSSVTRWKGAFLLLCYGMYLTYLLGSIV